MNILIVFATYSSGTLTAVQVAQDHLVGNGNTVTLKQAKDTQLDEFNNYDLIVMASPSWLIEKKDGMPHQDMLALIRSGEGKIYENKKFAVFGLGDETFARFAGAVDHMEKFVSDVKGRLVYPSLRIDSFYYFQQKNEEMLRNWLSEVIKVTSV